MKKRRRRRIHLGEVSKKDFISIADVLCRNSASSAVVSGLAHYFGSQNPRFDQNRFVAATSKCRA